MEKRYKVRNARILLTLSGTVMQKDGLEWRIEMSNDSIPKDPVMLLSYVNTQLRDFYPDIEEMCKSLDIDREELENKLAAIDYKYDGSMNKFV